MSTFPNPWHLTFDTQKRAPLDYLFFASFTYFFCLSYGNLTQSQRNQVEISFLPYCNTASASFRRKTWKPDSTTWTVMGGNLTTAGPALLVWPERLVLSSLHLHKRRRQISRHPNLLGFKKNPTTHLVMQLSRFCTILMHLSVPLHRWTMIRGQCTKSGLGEITVEDIGRG